MALFENPVLQRELLVNLRRPQSFVLLGVYLIALGAVVYAAWPQDLLIEMHSESRPEASRRLVNMFFLGQYLLASMIAPSFAAGAITGEKERHTFELLLTTPMSPNSVILGKLFGSLCHLGLLIFSSLPIVMLCLPAGGTSLYEVLTVYLAILIAAAVWGMISLAWSSYFRRTASSLVVSYLSILPLALAGLLVWQGLEAAGGTFRLAATIVVLPAAAFALSMALLSKTRERLLHPPDLGSEGKEVIDEVQEMQQAVGLVIERHQFPDKLFAPPRRVDLMADGANPVYDKEVHAEVFSQGTLMLRIVIMVSMFLAIPLMAFCLFFYAQHTRWYVAYVLLFNLLVGPTFSAGSVTSERERGTLALLLTTILSPWQILWGKLISGLRISTVLTLFLVWPVLLACAMNPDLWTQTNLLGMGASLAIILMTCLTTAMVGMFCSVLFKKTSVSLLTTYVVLLLIFFLPAAELFFVATFYPTRAEEAIFANSAFLSPFTAEFSIPFHFASRDGSKVSTLGTDWTMVIVHLAFYGLINLGLISTMIWLFNRRWRVAN